MDGMVNAETPATAGMGQGIRAGDRGTVVVVTSGKGGVGKSTSSTALGAALAMLGDSVVMIDFDIGLRKLDLMVGAERQVVYDMIDVIEGRGNLNQALVLAKQVPGLSLLPASSVRDKNALTGPGVRRIIDELATRFRWVICDSPAGIEAGAEMAMMEADVAVVVVNPEVASVRDSDRIIGLLDSKPRRAREGGHIEKHLLVTRYDPKRASRAQMMTTDQIVSVLDIPLLGVIPESMDILDSSNIGRPVTFNKPGGETAKAYVRAARKLRGEVETKAKPGILRRLFGRD